MTPDEPPDNDKTRIAPRGEADEPTAMFDPTQVYAGTVPAAPPPAAPRPPVHDDGGDGLPLGTRLAEFELTKLVGVGGFGIVYQATDHSLQRRVALKEYMPSSLAQRMGGSLVQVKSERYRETFEAGLKSFINEARLLASFDHPALVKVYRFWEANGTAYMVMPFLEGKTLRDVLRARAQVPDEAWLRSVLGPLSDALEVIHTEQCYHRDIAPDNVMLLNGSNRWLLLDFGAARRVIGDMTQALTVILKPGYAPVEQYAEIPGMKQGAWTDVYALAAVVHYAITGRTPPPSVGRLLNDTYQPLVQAAAGRYSERFLAAVDRALAVRPEARTQTIAQFREEMGLNEPATLMGGAPVPPTVVMGLGQQPTQLLADAPTAIAPRPAAAQTLIAPTQAVPATALPPAAAPAQGNRTVLPPVAANPAPTAAPAPASKGSGATVGIAVGALVLAGLGFGAWKMMDSSPVPQAAAPAAAPAPSPAATPAPAPAPVAAAPVAPPPPTRFEPEREFERIVQAQAGGFGVTAQPQKAELSIARSEEFRFKVTAERDGHLYVLGYSPDGSLALVVPNKNSPKVRVKKGQTYSFPTRDGFFLSAAEPPGQSRLLVIVSAQERSFDAMRPKSEGPVRFFPTGADALALAAQFKGTNSPLAGQPLCPASQPDCLDEYGAAVMNFQTVR